MTVNDHPPASSAGSDPGVLDQLAKIQRICLVIVMLIAAVTVAAWILSEFGVRLPSGFTLMKANTALALFASAASLMLSQANRPRRSLLLSRVLAILVGVLGVSSLVEHGLHVSLGLDTLIAPDPHSFHPGLMSPESGISFTLMAVVLFFIRAPRGLARYIADLFVACLSVLVMIIIAGYFSGAKSPFMVAPTNWTAPQTLLSFALLSFVCFGIRAEYGFFGVLVGRGIASRIARLLTPLVLLLPFLREFGRARLLHSRFLPEHYATAIMASTAAVISFVLMMVLVRYIKRMEDEIHDLSLRDELTGLYNLRGFQLFAEQALRLAQRSHLPFSVLFVDVDHLKKINDELGHAVGSAYLIETGLLLQQTFRETDVIARIGGDEFAIAGQFSDPGITTAAERLEEASESAEPELDRRFPLRLSIGHVTTNGGRDSVKDLLAKADKAMYEHKKGKRLQLR